MKEDGRLPGQVILEGEERYRQFDRYLQTHGIRKIFVVCGRSFDRMQMKEHLESLRPQGVEWVRFSEFQPNPLYENVVEGVRHFNTSKADLILAVGGGSAMDVAKCIKLYCRMNPEENYLRQPIVPNDVRLVALPTTAGTGSEATRYAVIYDHGEKQSVTDESCIPEAVFFEPAAIDSLPIQQKKATMLDALCHALESFWSVNSTEESRAYSETAIRSILAHMDGYFANDLPDLAAMQQAAYVAGKAINITQTTAGHAMCYKLTSYYGLPHGQAAALCVAQLWPYMLAHLEDCCDARGKEYLTEMFQKLVDAMEKETPQKAAEAFQMLLLNLGMTFPLGKGNREDVEKLASSVNPVRLKNHPIRLPHDAVAAMYARILGVVWDRAKAKEGTSVD